MSHMVQRSKAATLRPLAASFLALALLAAAGGAQAHSRPHEHGVASLDVAVDGAQLTVLLNMPLDGLLGFERPPRNDRERQAADAALALLRDGARMFGPEAAAQCTLQSVVLRRRETYRPRAITPSLMPPPCSAAPSPPPCRG